MWQIESYSKSSNCMQRVQNEQIVFPWSIVNGAGAYPEPSLPWTSLDDKTLIFRL